MLSIQEVGLEIMNGTPRKLYFFGGPEYGVKLRYIKMISSKYDNRIVQYDSMNSLITMLSTKRLVPLPPSVYVIRYDDEFVSHLDTEYVRKINAAKIVGTVVCIYDTDKSLQKIDKYFPNNTVRIENVSKRFIVSYLHMDFPKLPDKLIDIAADIAVDYNQAQIFCKSFSFGDVESLYMIPEEDIKKLFGSVCHYNDDQVKLCIASRNYKAIMTCYESYEGDTDSFIYSVMSTMIELEKISCSPRVDSKLREYLKLWKRKDIYNMFMQAYETLLNLRTISNSAEECVVYLAGLLQFSEIPSVEEMK